MRKLISLQQLIDQAQKDGMDPRDLAVDEDDVFSLDELDDDLEENPEENPDEEE
jgi:hypothetical protein